MRPIIISAVAAILAPAALATPAADDYTVVGFEAAGDGTAGSPVTVRLLLHEYSGGAGSATLRAPSALVVDGPHTQGFDFENGSDAALTWTLTPSASGWWQGSVEHRYGRESFFVAVSDEVQRVARNPAELVPSSFDLNVAATSAGSGVHVEAEARATPWLLTPIVRMRLMWGPSFECDGCPIAAFAVGEQIPEGDGSVAANYTITARDAPRGAATAWVTMLAPFRGEGNSTWKLGGPAHCVNAWFEASGGNVTITRQEPCGAPPADYGARFPPRTPSTRTVADTTGATVALVAGAVVAITRRWKP